MGGMKKASLLNRIEQIRVHAEDNEITELTKIELLDLLLDYINDGDIRSVIDEVPL
jgi:hypothetical protein